MYHILLPFHLGEFKQLKIEKSNIFLFKDYLSIKSNFKYHKLKLAWNEAVCNTFAMENNIKFIDLEGLNKLNISEQVSIFDPLDFDLLDIFKKKFGNNLIVLELTESFILNNQSLNNIYNKIIKNNKSHISHKIFFDYIKDHLNILKDIKSTDLQNRESIKKLNDKIPKFPNFINKDKMLNICEDAINFVNKKYPNNPGNADNLKYIPICKKNAILYFNKFIKERLYLYGKMQDAINNDEIILFHSHCSYLINIGLLNPRYLLNIIMKEANINKEITLNNIEGFIRQLLGWREYMRYIYHFWGRELKKEMIIMKGEKLNFNNWYNGKTGILPIDNEINKVKLWAWSHHIIRLMIFLNFMKLNEIRVFDIYKWFITFVNLDAYEWVMVSNIMAMGFYNKRFMRRGYISSSNYILKMSNYKKDDKWNIVWDNLYKKYIKKYGRFS